MTCQRCDRALDHGVVCSTCIGEAVAVLRRMPDVLAELQVTLAKQGRTGEREPGRSERYGLPLHLGAFDALSRCDVLLGYWSSWVARKTHVARNRRGGRAAQIGLLLANVNWVASQDLAVRFVDDLTTWHRTSLALVDLEPDRWYAGPCPGCGRDQYVKRSLTHILCTCGELTDVAQRRELLMSKVADHLATPVTPSQIRGWVHRGRLVAKGRNRDRRPLYRIGDVLDLALGRGVARVGSER